MPESTCVKNVEIAGKQHGKASAASSTQTPQTTYTLQPDRVQPSFFTNFIPTFPLLFSPLKIAASPLIEHYFYPVSTAPIINRSQINSKKGSN